ncbi:hypothetical protein [Breoghania sp.]|uniref:hypothetical protein n=1 Tax=Breoghania sp. TaxID=2065378 RepID=UPI00261A5265|nr:hypothetical protein [Breoghania sp.]MDJ0931375.1 hypothetical protein [Breoghania sp.]
MWKLSVIIFIIAVPALAGIGALVPLTVFGVGQIDARAMLAAIALGVMIALPVSYWVAKRISTLVNPHRGHPA